jgi:hypothetical protein
MRRRKLKEKISRGAEWGRRDRKGRENSLTLILSFIIRGSKFYYNRQIEVAGGEWRRTVLFIFFKIITSNFGV